MNNKVISIEVGRNFTYMISMYGDILQEIMYIPQDYKADEIVYTVFFNIPIDSPEDIICYDANGLGVMISDATINNDDFGYKEIMKPMNHKEVLEAGTMLNIAKEKLLDYAISSNLGGLRHTEFKKLCKEVNNLELEQGTECRVRLVQKDKSIGVGRARCFLNGLYILNKNK